jgi:hypothetical protein
MTTNPQDNLGPWRDCGLLKNGCRSEGRCLGHSMTHIEDSELRKGIASEFDLLALHINQHKLYTPSAEMNGEINQRVNAAMALIKSDREAMKPSRPITTDDLDNYLAYVKSHEGDFDDFNVAMVKTVLGSLATYIKARDETAAAMAAREEPKS